MFVYNKQKSRRDKELNSQSVESAMLKQVEIQNRKYEIEKLYRSHNSQRYEVNSKS